MVHNKMQRSFLTASRSAIEILDSRLAVSWTAAQVFHHEKPLFLQ
jgi:hypothetical protein